QHQLLPQQQHQPLPQQQHQLLLRQPPAELQLVRQPLLLLVVLQQHQQLLRQQSLVFAPVGIYALTIPTCATWNETGITMGGNSNGSVGSDLLSLSSPVSIFIDNNDNLFVCDRDNYRILKFTPNSTTGIIVAGNGTAGNESNQLRGPKGV
ncbi:unnamed protein product, partial [Rotaria sp. Silwood1]